MKRLFLAFAFMIMSLTAFAQTPEEKSNFLSNEMNTLLSLNADQLFKAQVINQRRFSVEDLFKERLATNEMYAAALANNLKGNKSAELLQQVATIRTNGENRYDIALKAILTPTQFSTYQANKIALFDSVRAEFGE